MWQRAAIAAVAVAAAVALSIPVIRALQRRTSAATGRPSPVACAPDGTELGAGDDVLDAAISPNQQEVVFVARRLDAAARAILQVPRSCGAGGSTHRVPNRWPEPRARVSLPGSTPETSSHFLPQRG